MHNSTLIKKRKKQTAYSLSAKDAKPAIDPGADQLVRVLII